MKKEIIVDSESYTVQTCTAIPYKNAGDRNRQNALIYYPTDFHYPDGIVFNRDISSVNTADDIQALEDDFYYSDYYFDNKTLNKIVFSSIIVDGDPDLSGLFSYDPSMVYRYRISQFDRDFDYCPYSLGGRYYDIVREIPAGIHDQASMDDAFLRIYEDPVGVLLDCMRISKSFSWGCGGWMLELAYCETDCLHHIDISERDARAEFEKRNTEK